MTNSPSTKPVGTQTAARRLTGLLVAGAIASGASLASSTGPTEPAGAPVAAATAATAGPRHSMETGAAQAATRTHTAAVATTSADVEAAVADQTLGNEMPPGVRQTAVTHQLDAQGAFELRNSVDSSYGATLWSDGYCGGAVTGFDIYSSGFEWLRLATFENGAWNVGTWLAVPQLFDVHIPLPIATPNIIYVVQGWDETPAGGELQTVFTSFKRMPNILDMTWGC